MGATIDNIITNTPIASSKTLFLQDNKPETQLSFQDILLNPFDKKSQKFDKEPGLKENKLESANSKEEKVEAKSDSLVQHNYASEQENLSSEEKFATDILELPTADSVLLSQVLAAGYLNSEYNLRNNSNNNNFIPEFTLKEYTEEITGIKSGYLKGFTSENTLLKESDINLIAVAPTNHEINLLQGDNNLEQNMPEIIFSADENSKKQFNLDSKIELPTNIVEQQDFPPQDLLKQQLTSVNNLKMEKDIALIQTSPSQNIENLDNNLNNIDQIAKDFGESPKINNHLESENINTPPASSLSDDNSLARKGQVDMHDTKIEILNEEPQEKIIKKDEEKTELKKDPEYNNVHHVKDQSKIHYADSKFSKNYEDAILMTNQNIDQVPIKFIEKIYSDNEKIILQLHPAELGKLEFRFETKESGRHISVIVDKASTLELLQKDDYLKKILVNEGLNSEGATLDYRQNSDSSKQQERETEKLFTTISFKKSEDFKNIEEHEKIIERQYVGLLNLSA